MQAAHGSIARVKIVDLWVHLIHVYIQLLRGKPPEHKLQNLLEF